MVDTGNGDDRLPSPVVAIRILSAVTNRLASVMIPIGGARRMSWIDDAASAAGRPAGTATLAVQSSLTGGVAGHRVHQIRRSAN